VRSIHSDYNDNINIPLNIIFISLESVNLQKIYLIRKRILFVHVGYAHFVGFEHVSDDIVVFDLEE
jgi:hypothetical protein